MALACDKRMSEYHVTVFEVLDNFFGSEKCPTVERLSDPELLELRQHVIDFYETYQIPPPSEYETRLYLGGFLSSPPFPIESSPYISSALLHSDSIVLFDPLHYGLCDEQYQRLRLLSQPVGWRNPNTGLPDYSLTRKYLKAVFPWLYDLRPLVEAGIVVLVPAEHIVYTRLNQISDLVQGITDFLEPVETLADTFAPEEITVDDNRKGMFAFAGRNHEIRIRECLGYGIEQFAKDVIVANETVSIYTAPFRWEYHLGKSSLNRFAEAEYHVTVVEGIRSLHLPILAKLSPDLLLKIHRDSKYVEFRAELSEVLRHIHAEIGSQDFADQVAQIERDILLPKAEAIRREIASRGFRAATKALKKGTFVFGLTFLPYVVAPDTDVNRGLIPSGIAAGLSVLREMYQAITRSRDHRIWAQLLPEKPSLSLYGSPLILKQGGQVAGWKIGEQPSMTITISKGVFKFPQWLLEKPRSASQMYLNQQVLGICAASPSRDHPPV
jgi:hypothetical protein